MSNLIESMVFNPIINSLNGLRKAVGDNIVSSILGLPKKEININLDLDLLNDLLNLYISKYSKDQQTDLSIINTFNEYLNENLNDLEYKEENNNSKNLQNFYNLIFSILLIINELLNIVRLRKKDYKTSEFFLWSESGNEFPFLKKKLTSIIKDFLESFIKIRGNYISEELKHNTLEILNYVKEGKSSKSLQEIEELFFDVIRKNQDYEYYIICKDKVFTTIPSSHIWFEFLLHISYLYENHIDFNSLEELYTKRLLPSFTISKLWYKSLYNNVICKTYEKLDIYNSILQTIDELEKYFTNLFENIKKTYPEKSEIDEKFFTSKLQFLYNKTEEIQKLSIVIEPNVLKGTGIFENFYHILIEVYAERESLLSLYEFYNSLSNVLANLEEWEPDFITPLDKKVLESKDKFEILLDYIYKYLQIQDKDYLVEIINYFKNHIESLILEVREDTKKIEKLLEPEKIVCLNCGYSNEFYRENCAQCGKKLLKPSLIESQGVFKTILTKLKKLNDLKELSSYITLMLNFSNSALSNMNSLKLQLERIQNEIVYDILDKVNIIINNLLFIREKIAILNTYDPSSITFEILEEVISEIDVPIEELEQNLNSLYSFIKSLDNTRN